MSEKTITNAPPTKPIKTAKTKTVKPVNPVRKDNPFPLVSAASMTDKPIQIEWLVKNILEQGSLNLLFGEPATGKSLFALDWAFCMVAGMEWHGLRTKQTDVVIVAGEGLAGMQRRLKALEEKYGIKSPKNLFISKKPAQLLDKSSAEAVATSIKALCPNPGLVIIDTLHRNMDGDENSSQDIGKFIYNLDTYMKPLGAAVLVVHHSGHNDKRRSRGSSSIRAAMDGEFSTNKSTVDIITLACHKAKDFEALNPLSFEIKQTELGLDWLDDEGKPLTSVYLVSSNFKSSLPNAGKLSAQDNAVLVSLDQAITTYGENPTAAIKSQFGYFDAEPDDQARKIVSVKNWEKEATKVIRCKSVTPAALRMAFKRCREKLIEQCVIIECDGYVWRVHES
ncbi:MAG: AAA family ATPase [Methylococcales bacterium]